MGLSGFCTEGIISLSTVLSLKEHRNRTADDAIPPVRNPEGGCIRTYRKSQLNETRNWNRNRNTVCLLKTVPPANCVLWDR